MCHYAGWRRQLHFNSERIRRSRIIDNGLRLKFQQNESLKQLLLLTRGDLVESSPKDSIWGIGFSESNALKNKHRWGENLLGQCLMTVREELSTMDD